MKPEGVVFKSGAASSKIPRLDLIPRKALLRVAGRFELGLERHGERSWNAASSQACLEDREFLIYRAAHVIDHALKLIAKLRGQLPDDGDDDAAAIAWGGICLCEATEQTGVAPALEQPSKRESGVTGSSYSRVGGGGHIPPYPAPPPPKAPPPKK
jgi:hypothetical protein